MTERRDHQTSPGGTAVSCVFCEIIVGTTSAIIVYSDDNTVAFMDQRQPNIAAGGHVLVVPKRHVQTVYDLDTETAGHLMSDTVRIARAVRDSFAPTGLSIWQSNGEAAEQEVPHVHMHVLARLPGDGLLRVYQEQPPYPAPEERARTGAAIRAAIT